MGIWVRSQNKARLSVCNDFDIYTILNEDTPYVVSANNRDFGYYETLERANRVLDEIQNFIYNDSFDEYCIFDMPAE